ncbi:hypothetical protein IFM89_007422 [Coptis chinensis]|uniref:Uncharacterized protein n=1 Tax=Coptis chinensis TaxID=261450 RepID=A0A835MEC9_9MAGN|nr:hypothetical protein IFM89_007422 [Coptis chinensis]
MAPDSHTSQLLGNSPTITKLPIEFDEDGVAVGPNHAKWNIQEQVEASHKRRKEASAGGEGSVMEVDFDNDELSEVFGPDKGSRTRGISSNKSRKQLQHTGITKALLQQASSSSNYELKGEMSEMKSSLANVMGMLKEIPNVKEADVQEIVRVQKQEMPEKIRMNMEMAPKLSRENSFYMAELAMRSCLVLIHTHAIFGAFGDSPDGIGNTDASFVMGAGKLPKVCS